eukprot:8016251-Lingulodinium_polyedra.AAC.1
MGRVHDRALVAGKAPEPGVVGLRVLEIVQAPEGRVVGSGCVALAEVMPALLVQVLEEGALEV